MRRLKFLLPVFLLLGCILLCGCDLRNYIYTEDSLKRVAEKSLKKKYGEEFIIHDVWERDQTRFFADCAPKDNPRAVFLATICKNGEGVDGDEYPEAVVSLEVTEVLRDGAKEVFGDCYVKSFVKKYYTRPEFESPRLLTLEEYLKATDTDMICRFFVMNQEISEDTVKKEYYYLSETFPKEVRAAGIADGQFRAVRIYFVDEEMMKKSEEYFLTDSDIRGEFDSVLRKYHSFRCFYKDGKLEQSYEEYLESRMRNQEEINK